MLPRLQAPCTQQQQQQHRSGLFHAGKHFHDDRKFIGRRRSEFSHRNDCLSMILVKDLECLSHRSLH